MSRGLAHRAALVAALAGSALLAAPAFGSPSPLGGVQAGRHISVVHNIDLVAAFGYPSGETLEIEIEREGIPIGRVAAPVYPAEIGWGLEVNHGPEGTIRPGDCFEQVTPDIRPGDLIEVTPSAGAPVSRALVDDLLIQAVAGDGDDVVVTGIAKYANGAPIAAADLNAGEWRIPNGPRGANPAVTNPSGEFTARYTQISNFGSDQPVSQASVLNADHAFGYGHVAPAPAEIQLVEGAGQANGPFTAEDPEGLSCPGRASLPNDLTVVDDAIVNASSGALKLSGPTNGADAPTVTLDDGDGPVAPEVVQVEPGKAWRVQFTRQQLDGQVADGQLTATVTFPGETPLTRTIQKDTVAPAPPTGTPPPGTYAGDQFVNLEAEPGARIRYTLDGSDPSAGQIFGESIRVSQPTAIQAVAIDAAGNESTDTTLEYDIRPPAPGAGGGGAAGGAAGGETGRGTAPSDQGAGPAESSAMQVTNLRTRSRVRLAGARRRGVTASFVSPPGARVARVELFRVARAAQRSRPVGAVTVTLRRAGRQSVRLASSRMRRALRPGAYRLVVRVGTSRSELGRAAVKRLRIVR